MVDEDNIKAKLTPEEYAVLRQQGTEIPFSGKDLKIQEAGDYLCKVCGNRLFPSETKFESTAPGLRGWPSFDQAVPGSIELREDNSAGMNRTEVICAKCKSHLGHLFDDPEAKTGEHYCINSICLDFRPEGE